MAIEVTFGDVGFRAFQLLSALSEFPRARRYLSALPTTNTSLWCPLLVDTVFRTLRAILPIILWVLWISLDCKPMTCGSNMEERELKIKILINHKLLESQWVRSLRNERGMGLEESQGEDHIATQEGVVTGHHEKKHALFVWSYVKRPNAAPTPGYRSITAYQSPTTSHNV